MNKNTVYKILSHFYAFAIDFLKTKETEFSVFKNDEKVILVSFQTYIKHVNEYLKIGFVK